MIRQNLWVWIRGLGLAQVASAGPGTSIRAINDGPALTGKRYCNMVWL